MDEVQGFAGSARWTMRLLAVPACLALLMAGEIQADPAPTTGTAQHHQQVSEAARKAEAAKKAEAEQRHDAADRLITLRQMIWAEQRNGVTEGLADRTDKLLLVLVDGNPTPEFNSEIKSIERDVVTVRRKAVQASVTGAASQDASSEKGRSFGAGFAVLLSLSSIVLSLFLFLRRRHVVEQTLRDAGLL